MKNRVYLNRVAVDYQTIYAKAKDYFKRHDVDIQFDFVQSDYKNLSYVIRQFPQGQRVILQPAMSNVVPIDSTYDFTSFVFNGREFPPPNIPTGYCYCPIKQPFMDILTDPLNPAGLDEVTVKHEMMHALVLKANLAGFQTHDVMDTYYLNDQPDNPLSNFGQQWVLLQPYIHSLQAPNLPPATTLPPVTITRQVGVNGETVGDLNAGNFKAKTLELPFMNNMPNISCIPLGEYDVKWTFSPRLLKFTYEVQAVPKRSGIRIHSANYYYELKGCIALGDSVADLNHDGKMDTINSRLTIKAFEDYMNRKPFRLIIK